MIFLLAHLAAFGQCCFFIVRLDPIGGVSKHFRGQNAEELSNKTRIYDEGTWGDDDGLKDVWEAPDTRWD